MNKVFHLITTINRGGAENQLKVLVTEQINQGFEVHVVYLKGDPELREDFEKVGAVVNNDLANKSVLLQPYKLSRVAGIKDSIIHAHLPRAELVALLSPNRFKLIVTRHNAEPFFPKAPKIISRLLSNFVSLRAHRVIAISQAVKDFLYASKELFDNEKIVLIRYGYLSQFTSKDRSIKEHNYISKVGTVARLAEQKDLPTLISSFDIVSDKIENVRLDIIGAGPLEHQLKDLVKVKKLTGKVNFLGRSNRILEFLSTLDVFVLTSKYEGFGLVLLEAMDAGIPIVAARNSAIPEVLGTQFPGLCETGNPQDFALKILALQNSKYRHEILAVQEERLSLFSSEKMASATKAVYEN